MAKVCGFAPKRTAFGCMFDGTPPRFHAHAEVFIMQFAGGNIATELLLDNETTTAEDYAAWIVKHLLDEKKKGNININDVCAIGSDNEATAQAACRLALEELTKLNYDVSHCVVEGCLAHTFDILWKHFMRKVILGEKLVNAVHSYYWGGGDLSQRRSQAY